MLASRGLFWLHALDLIDRQSRPKLYIRLIDQGGTTRIRGRMLPGITGPIAIVAMTPLALAWMVAMAFREPGYRVADPFGLVLARILLILAVLLSIGALWWLLGRSQREGRPIENAVRRALGISAPASRE